MEKLPFDTLISSLFIHSCFANSSLLVGVVLQVLKGYPLVLLLNLCNRYARFRYRCTQLAVKIFKKFEYKVGGICGMEWAYNFHELVKSANSMDHFVNHRVWVELVEWYKCSWITTYVTF